MDEHHSSSGPRSHVTPSQTWTYTTGWVESATETQCGDQNWLVAGGFQVSDADGDDADNEDNTRKLERFSNLLFFQSHPLNKDISAGSPLLRDEICSKWNMFPNDNWFPHAGNVSWVDGHNAHCAFNENWQVALPFTHSGNQKLLLSIKADENAKQKAWIPANCMDATL